MLLSLCVTLKKTSSPLKLAIREKLLGKCWSLPMMRRSKFEFEVFFISSFRSSDLTLRSSPQLRIRGNYNILRSSRWHHFLNLLIIMTSDCKMLLLIFQSTIEVQYACGLLRPIIDMLVIGLCGGGLDRSGMQRT